MKTKTEYKIITASSSVHLSNKVNDFLAQGWLLAGGVSATVLGGNLWYAQAMTLTTHEY